MCLCTHHRVGAGLEVGEPAPEPVLSEAPAAEPEYEPGDEAPGLDSEAHEELENLASDAKPESPLLPGFSGFDDDEEEPRDPIDPMDL